jgi:hypothetical protein
MYRHVLVNSLASSASFVVVRMVVVTIRRKNADARSAATSSSAPTICGSECSSSRA